MADFFSFSTNQLILNIKLDMYLGFTHRYMLILKANSLKKYIICMFKKHLYLDFIKDHFILFGWKFNPSTRDCLFLVR